MNELFKSKAELDKIETEDDIIKNVRWVILRNDDDSIKEDKKAYIKELEFYCERRFNSFDNMIERFIEELKDPKSMHEDTYRLKKISVDIKDYTKMLKNREIENHVFKYIL